jgi:hypothetical protein
MEEKKALIMEGYVKDISSITQIRRTTKPDLLKVMITILTEDGQTVFMEIRNSNIKELQREGIEVNSHVVIEFIFEGSEKGDMKYNNIIIKKIKLKR